MHARERKDNPLAGCHVWPGTGTLGLSAGLLAAACVLATVGCSTTPSVPDADRAPETPCACEGGGAAETAGIPEGECAPEAAGACEGGSAPIVSPPVPDGDSAPEETRREVCELWEKFRGLLLKGERDPGAFKGLVDEPDGFVHLTRCLAEGVDLSVEWLRMSSEDLRRAEAHFRFYLDREECEVHFTGLGGEASPELLLRLIDGRWIVWPERG